MPALRHDGVDLWYEVRGDGPPLLLVAGLAADGSYWLPAVDALAQRHTVVLVDNRGCGRTTPLGAPASVGAMADDCMALVRHLDLAPATLVGHSMGGMIAQACAARYPDEVDRLVLVATGARSSARNDDLFAMRATYAGDGLPVTSRWISCLATNGPVFGCMNTLCTAASMSCCAV